MQVDLDELRAELTKGPPRWMADALCVEPAYEDVEFFPVRGESTAEAKSVCERCIVRWECLQYAIEMGEQHGIWGGTSGRERRRLRR